MKKLKLYDHLGNLKKEFDIYVEGQDFRYTFSTPVAVWLGTISLEGIGKAEIVEGELRLEEETQAYVSEQKEVEVESEEISDKGRRDNRLGETSKLEGLEVISEVDTAGDIAERGEGDRKPKASKNHVGGWPKFRAPKGSRRKAKGTNIKEE